MTLLPELCSRETRLTKQKCNIPAMRLCKSSSQKYPKDVVIVEEPIESEYCMYYLQESDMPVILEVSPDYQLYYYLTRICVDIFYHPWSSGLLSFMRHQSLLFELCNDMIYPWLHKCLSSSCTQHVNSGVARNLPRVKLSLEFIPKRQKFRKIFSYLGIRFFENIIHFSFFNEN